MVTPNDEVTLDASESKVEEGSPVVKWQIDGTDQSATALTLKSTFSVGIHRVTISVADAKGLSDTASVTITSK